MSSLTSVMQRLDEQRATRLREEAIDFDGYMRAREDDVGNIKTPRTYHEELIDEFFGDPRQHGLTLPWRKTHDEFLIRPGEVTVWTGFNGHMKSMCTGYVLLHLIHQGSKACVASFEMKPRKTLRRMVSQAVGTRAPTELAVEKFLNLVEGNLWLYDQQGEVTPQRILGVIYYCAEKLGVTQFVIDSMMKVVSAEDDYNGQKRFIGQLCTAAQDLNIHIHLVHHSRKRDDEAHRPGKQDAKGSGSVVDQCDNFIVVYKFPKKDSDPDDKPTHGLYVDKQRHGEWEGLVALWFDDQSLQFKESSADKRKSFV